MNTTCTIVTVAIVVLILLMVFGGQSGYAELGMESDSETKKYGKKVPGPVRYIKKGESCGGVACTASMCNCNN